MIVKCHENAVFEECQTLLARDRKHTVIHNNQNKMKNKTPKSNIQIVERVRMDTPKTHIHDRSLSWIVCTLIIIKKKSGGLSSFYRPKVAPLLLK